MHNLFTRELNLPVRGLTQRVTRREFIAPGDTFAFFDETGPGCIRHWWLTYTPIRDPDVRDARQGFRRPEISHRTPCRKCGNSHQTRQSKQRTMATLSFLFHAAQEWVRTASFLANG
jgi:hypothetical protein